MIYVIFFMLINAAINNMTGFQSLYTQSNIILREKQNAHFKNHVKNGFSSKLKMEASKSFIEKNNTENIGDLIYELPDYITIINKIDESENGKLHKI